MYNNRVWSRPTLYFKCHEIIFVSEQFPLEEELNKDIFLYSEALFVLAKFKNFFSPRMKVLEGAGNYADMERIKQVGCSTYIQTYNILQFC